MTMNILYLVILLLIYYKGSHCFEPTQFNDEDKHSKVRFVSSTSENRANRRSINYWSTTEHTNDENTTTISTIRKRKRLRTGTTPKSLNITEIIGYLNNNADDSVKVLNPAASAHFDNFGRSVIRQGARRNDTVDNVMVNLKDLQQNLGRFECDLDNGGCAQFCSEATQTKCSCFNGFILGSDHKRCLDVNECASDKHGCSHLCLNTYGSYRCSCPRGLRLDDDQRTCVDINECLLRNGHGPCQDVCLNNFGSYECRCLLPGTRLSLDGRSCVDIDECTEGISGCSHGCINVIGGAFCTCPDGMRLESDYKMCAITEIRNSIEQNDAPAVENLCPPLVAPEHGFFYCSQKSSGYFNREDSLCQLVCPSGYKTLGDYKVVCNPDGTWNGPTSGKCLALLDGNFNRLKNYIDFIWDYPKPKIICSASRLLYVRKEERFAYVSFSLPKTNVDWSHVESYPPEIKKNLEAYLRPGHHWIVFKATHPETKLTAKCIISIIVKRESE